MTVCIDTNVVLGMFGRNDPWLLIRQALMDRRLVWAVTTEILLEYEEDAAREMGITAAGQLTRFIDLLEQTRGNIRHVSPTFRLHLITSGPDDYKFTGTATSPHSPRPETIPSPSPRRSSLPSTCSAFLHSPFQRFRFQNFSFYHNASPPTSAPRRKSTPSPAPRTSSGFGVLSPQVESDEGNLKGFWSIRINQQWRIVFRWKDGNAADVQITDYH